MPTCGIFEAVRSILSRPSYGHNIAYDLACLAAWYPIRFEIFRALDASLIVDTMIIERLVATLRGDEFTPLSLSDVGKKYGLAEVSGKGEVQLSYGPLLNRPIDEYTEEQRQYSTNDSIHTEKVFTRQHARWIANYRIDLEDVAELTRRQFWLQCCSVRGIRTDPISIDDLRRVTQAEVEHYREIFAAEGFLRADGSKNMAEIRQAVTEAYDGKPPMTQDRGAGRKKREAKKKAGIPFKPFEPNVQTSRGVLEDSGDPRLEDFAHYGETAAVLNKDLPMLLGGVTHPIHTRFSIVTTCRTSSSGPNIQNPRRSSPKLCVDCGHINKQAAKDCKKCRGANLRRMPGIRECFVPRPGFAIVDVDHSGLELVTLAQQIVKILGLRRMADAINSGRDLHSDVGCLLAGTDYESFRQTVKAGDELAFSQRNCGKVYQFGRHGGMGAKTLKYYAKQGYGLDLTLAECENLIRVGAQANPDGAEYLRAISRIYPKDENGRFTVKCWGSNVTRGGCTYSAAANHGFQSLGAWIESRVGHEMMREQLTGFDRSGRRSVLGACFMINHVHDSFMHEVPINLVHDCAERVSELMREIPKPLLPDVQIQCEVVAMDRWSKSAKLQRDENGKITVWHYT